MQKTNTKEKGGMYLNSENKKSFDINSENVEQFLYGNIYGKKSGS